MNSIKSFFQELFYSIPTLGVMDIVDILVVAFIIYKVMLLIRSTSTARVARSILLLLVMTWLTDVVHMYALNWILTKIIEVGVIALVIVFQPELRRVLERFGGKNILLSFTDSSANRSAEASAIEATVQACEIMARERVGVLLVFERQTSLDEYFKTGTLIDAKVTDQLLRNLFFKNSPLHDGAALIEGDRIVAAKCILPVTQSDVPKSFGTRHRAAIGMSEISDAIIVVVSEETGDISIAQGGEIRLNIDPVRLQQTLQRYLTINTRKRSKKEVAE